jgi:Fe-S-cluster formation regulator IscX/YfhJ
MFNSMQLVLSEKFYVLEPFVLIFVKLQPLIWFLDDGESDKGMSREKIMRIFRNDLSFQ